MFQFQPCNSCFNYFDNRLCNNVQIPSLPLKGPKPFEEILRFICKAIEGEASAADFYCHLLKEAPNKMHAEFIQHAYKDELEHLQILSKLYCYYTDTDPKYNIEPIHYQCYKEGIFLALLGELDTVEFYRNVQLSTMDMVIRDTFYMIMVDELEHATLFSTLYNSCPAK